MLGIHTEMFSDGVVELVEKGVITNENKVIHRHQISAGFVMGSNRLYEFIDDNPLVKLYRYHSFPFLAKTLESKTLTILIKFAKIQK